MVSIKFGSIIAACGIFACTASATRSDNVHRNLRTQGTEMPPDNAEIKPDLHFFSTTPAPASEEIKPDLHFFSTTPAPASEEIKPDLHFFSTPGATGTTKA